MGVIFIYHGIHGTLGIIPLFADSRIEKNKRARNTVSDPFGLIL
jgi:hypothetical protein